MNLAHFLKVNDWSQTDLAEKLDTSLQNVNKWMNGKGVPSYEYCKKLIELGMLADDLFDIDYKSMHDHDNYRSAIAEEKKKEIQERGFYEMFREAMAKWKEENKANESNL